MPRILIYRIQIVRTTMSKSRFNKWYVGCTVLYQLRLSTLVFCQTANVNTRRTMSWILYRVDRVGRVTRDPWVIVRVHRLGAGNQRCFNPLPCTAAINPAYPPSRVRSHTLRILLITRKLSCRRFTGSVPQS